jgi:hypothetical protein
MKMSTFSSAAKQHIADFIDIEQRCLASHLKVALLHSAIQGSGTFSQEYLHPDP